MQAPYGMTILENCPSCPVRANHLFCNMDARLVQKLNAIKSTAVYPETAVLFVEGQQPRGVFVVCSGRAKLSTASKAGKTIITKIAGPGEILGLEASISNYPYEVTAEMMEPGQANFIARDTLLELIGSEREVALKVAQLLSHNYFSAHDEIRTFGMSRSPAQKFAKLLLSWYPVNANGTAQIKVTFTHSEIADMIGTTRETVTRLFSEFTKRRLLQRIGATLIFRNKGALAQMVAN
jgi:CRP/FNR family transcriptional regulator